MLYASQQNLTRNMDIHNHQTRFARNFNIPAHRTVLYTKKPSYAGAKLLNLLPASTTDVPARTFKKWLRNWLLEDPVYSMEELFERARVLREE
ncbi:hypothetical protein J6590_035069 [Homalodisca vitripennis]|nr:hypothetical protein J6590_035069 [Homalodisca vitripennis]